MSVADKRRSTSRRPAEGGASESERRPVAAVAVIVVVVITVVVASIAVVPLRRSVPVTMGVAPFVAALRGAALTFVSRGVTVGVAVNRPRAAGESPAETLQQFPMRPLELAQ